MRLLCVIVTLISFWTFAQKKDCAVLSNDYKDKLKSNDFKAAYDSWLEVYQACPKLEKELYENGLAILSNQLETAPSEDKKLALRELLQVYDKYYQNFPTHLPDFEVKKALTIQRYTPEDSTAVFSLLQHAFQKPSLTITEPQAYSLYFQFFYHKYSQKEKGFTIETVLDLYQKLQSRIVAITNQDPALLEKMQPVLRNIKSKARPVLTCDIIIPYLQKKFPENKDDKVWLSESLAMVTQKCQVHPIVLQMAEELYRLSPDSKAAEYLGTVYYKSRKLSESERYFSEALKQQTDVNEKARLYFTMATTVYAGELSKSKEYLLQSLALRPKDSKIYLYLSQLYASNAEKCTANEKERKAIYYLALQTAQKAITIDRNAAVAVKSFSNTYQAKTFTKEELNGSMKGVSVSIGCWIQENVTLQPLP